MDVQLLQQILVWSQRHEGESHYPLFIVYATTKSSPVNSSRIYKSYKTILLISVDSKAPLGHKGSEPRYRRMQELAARGAGSDGGRDAQEARESNCKIKRAGDAQDATDGIVTDAAKDAASKTQ